MEEQNPSAEAIRTVVLAIGENLLTYQRIELQLKTCLPFATVPGQEASPDPFKEMRRLLASRETLGLVFERFKKANQIKDSLELDNMLSAVLEGRNELVHKFITLPFGNLATQAACDEAIIYLRMRAKEAEPLTQALDVLAKGFMAMLDEMDARDKLH